MPFINNLEETAYNRLNEVLRRDEVLSSTGRAWYYPQGLECEYRLRLAILLITYHQSSSARALCRNIIFDLDTDPATVVHRLEERLTIEERNSFYGYACSVFGGDLGSVYNILPLQSTLSFLLTQVINDPYSLFGVQRMQDTPGVLEVADPMLDSNYSLYSLGLTSVDIEPNREPNPALRRRPLIDGFNDISRNLNTAYQTTIVKYKGIPVYIHSFEGLTKVVVTIFKFDAESGNLNNDTSERIYFKEHEFDLTMPELGWIKCLDGTLMHLVLSPGNYLKALSNKNCLVSQILTSTEAINERTDLRRNLNVIKGLHEKNYFTSIEEGIRRNLDSFVVNPHIAVHRPSGNKEQRSIYFNELRVGSVGERGGYIKVYKKYIPILTTLQKVAKHECR